jgi:Outer membrane protein/protective antigen OMA87
MPKLILFFLISSFYFNILHAETIKKIEIVGNKRVSPETIKLYGGIEINKNYEEQDLNKILTDLYSTNFFEDVQINLSNGVLKVNVAEYPVINNLVILGEPSQRYKKQITELISSKNKESFIKSKLTSDVEIIKKLYASAGYNSANVTTKIREIDKNNLDVIFEIDKGKETRISKISFIGDKKIREKRLRDIIASEEHKFWKVISKNSKFSENLLSLDIRLLENYYKSLGYYDVNVSSQSAE